MDIFDKNAIIIVELESWIIWVYLFKIEYFQFTMCSHLQTEK